MIGEKIKELRTALGYSAEQVAAFLNVSPATVYRYENGDISKMPAKFIKPLAEFLCATPAELMGWTDSSSNSIDLLAKDERRLVTAYRDADPKIQELALMILEDSAAKKSAKKQDTASGQTA